MMYSKFISFLKQIPLPICGLILGLISLGNLLYSKGYPILGNSYDMLRKLPNSATLEDFKNLSKETRIASWLFRHDLIPDRIS